jgi:hypothetical protein
MSPAGATTITSSPGPGPKGRSAGPRKRKEPLVDRSIVASCQGTTWSSLVQNTRASSGALTAISGRRTISNGVPRSSTTGTFGVERGGAARSSATPPLMLAS